MADGSVVFEIKGDSTGINRTLESTTKNIAREAKKWDKSVDDTSGNISSHLTGAFKAVTASAAFIQISQMLIRLGTESITLASDLQEVQNVVDSTFGTAGAKKIDDWAKNAGEQFGLTELQAKKYASTIGSMLTSSDVPTDQVLEMSMALGGLVADMASYHNMDFDESFSKILSGMSGEVEPLRRLGINMSVASLEAFALGEGIETAFADMSQGEQTLLRYQYLMSKTSREQGDFAKTSDEFANSQRRMKTGFDTLKAQLGEALLPIATEITNAVNDLLDVLTQPTEDVFEQAGDSMAEAAGNAAQAQGILGYMDKLYEKYGDAATKTDEWQAALARLKEVFPEVNKYIDSETGALKKTNDELRQYVENTKQAAIEAAKQKAIQSLNDEYTQAGVDYYTAEINRDLANEQAKEAAMQLIDYIIADYKEQGIEEGEDTGEMLNRDAWYKSLAEGTLSMRDLLTEAKRAANNQGDDYGLLEEYAKIYDEQNKASVKAAEEMANLSSKMTDLQTKLSIANSALEKLASAAGGAASSVSSIHIQKPYANMPGLGGFGGIVEGTHAAGLDYVPHDNYLALLHRGERVQTAEEANMARQYGIRSPGVDYGAIGSAMWSNAPSMGGNVYLDGRIVGSVISKQQGASYRALQRSGWQG